MDAFDLDETVIERYKAFARSFTNIRSPELNAKVEELYATKRFWPEPLIQLNPHYAGGGSIQDFIDAGDLEPECGRGVSGPLGLREPSGSNAEAPQAPAAGHRLCPEPSELRRHDRDPARGSRCVSSFRSSTPRSRCGKRAGSPGTRAIVIYPMNALANSQAEETEALYRCGPPPHPHLRAIHRPGRPG